MPSTYYVRRGGKQFGPFEPKQLKQLAAAGKLTRDDSVSADRAKWTPAGNVKGLFPPAELLVRETPQAIPTVVKSESPLTAQVAPPPARQPASTEVPVWSGRPSQITNAKTFILCGLFFWLVIPVFVAASRWLVIRCIRYEVTTQRFRISYGVLSRQTNELELYRVKDTSLSQTIFQRMFQLASIRMVTSDSTSPIALIHSIPADQARNLREQIRTLTEELRDRKRVREVDYS